MDEEQKQENVHQNEAEEAMEESQPVQAATTGKSDAEENKFWALLSYLGILFLIPLLAKRDSKFVQFHAKQGLVLVIGEMFAWFPVFGWVLGIILFVFSVMGILNVLSGKETKLPIVGDLAEKINL